MAGVRRMAPGGYELRVFLISFAIFEAMLIYSEFKGAWPSDGLPPIRAMMLLGRPAETSRAVPPPCTDLSPRQPGMGDADSEAGILPYEMMKENQASSAVVYDALLQHERVEDLIANRTEPTFAVLGLHEDNVMRANTKAKPLLEAMVSGYRNVILTAATNVTFDYVYFLASTFNLANEDGSTLLVLCTGDTPLTIPPDRNFKHVAQFNYYDSADPKALGTTHVAIRRFLVYRVFLQLSGFQGNVFTVDSRDTIFQAMPFQFYPELDQGSIHVFAEPLSIRQDECCTTVWVRNCAKLLFGEEESESVFGHVSAFPIINAGTLMGRAKELLVFIDDFIATITDYPCNDQGLLDLMVYTGIHKDRSRLTVEPAGRGRVLTNDHAASLYSIEDLVIKNVLGQPYAVIHMWDRAKDTYNLITSGDYLNWPDRLKKLKEQQAQAAKAAAAAKGAAAAAADKAGVGGEREGTEGAAASVASSSRQ